MGWSSWNSYRIHINEDLIKGAADSLISKGLAEVGYNYVNIDDGWFGSIDSIGRTTDGIVRIHPVRFPNGMKVVADYIHSRGLKAGIYSDAGVNTCGSIWDNDAYGIGVGLYGHDEFDSEVFFNDWGYDYIKVDWCGGDATGKSEQERYTAIKNAMLKTGREDLRLNICRWEFPGTWAMNVGGSWRICHDITPEWGAVINQFNHSLYLAAYAGPGHFNDMDMIEIGNPKSTFTPTEEKAHFSLWCMMKSPLMMGCNLETVARDKVDIYKNTELIAINQDNLGEQAKVVWRKGDLITLACDLEEANGPVKAVCLFNKSEEPELMRINFSDLYLSNDATVRDLWKHEDLGQFKKYYETIVEPHETVVLKVKGKKAYDRTTYEGEYAFMNEYLPKDQEKRAHYAFLPEASGEYVMKNLGGSETNWAEFRNVCVSKAGSYDLTVYFTCEDQRGLNITVNNNGFFSLPRLSSGSKDKIEQKTIRIQLNKGNNVIRMSNSNAKAPDIDKITLIKK